MTVHHHVKSWTFLFDAFVSGEKTHDLRVMDRDYKVGDELVLQRYDYGAGVYTGEEALALITYITSADQPCAFSPAVLHPKYAILSIRKLSVWPHWYQPVAPIKSNKSVEPFESLVKDTMARFNVLPPAFQTEHRRAQRKSWVVGEMLLSHPEWTRKS